MIAARPGPVTPYWPGGRRKLLSLLMQKLRAGVVSFLNALPLWLALRHEPDLELVPDTPARLADMMARGELDIALLPVVEALRQPGLSFFPDLGISADGAVESVGLFTRLDMPDIQTVALSAASRTSNALARILLPRAGCEAADIAPEQLDQRAEDAVLLIGDACLRARRLKHERVYIDLAAEWKILTDLPFVFAVWAGKPEALTPRLHQRLRQALPEGRELVHDMIRYAAMDTGWSEAELGQYVSEVIVHELTPQALKGLLEFTRRAAEIGELPREAVDKVLDAMRQE